MNLNPLRDPRRTKRRWITLTLVLTLWLSQLPWRLLLRKKHTLKPPRNRAAQTNSAASLMLEAKKKQPPPSPAPQFRRPNPEANCWKSRRSKQTRAHFSQSSSGKGDAQKADDRVFAALLRCCCTLIDTIPSTSKVRTHGNELYTRGTPAQTRNIKRGKERKRAVIIGLLRNRGMLKDSRSCLS